jgi:hypothetical protein
MAFVLWLLAFFTQPPAAVSPQPSRSQYVGSERCGACHATTYARWKKTRMANVVRDPKVHPDAIIADMTTPNPLVTFTKNDIAFVYGGKWKQRYFTKVGDDYFPLGAQWERCTANGGRTWCRPTPTGGCRSIRPTT